MVQEEVQADGKLVVYEREIKGDEMHVVRHIYVLIRASLIALDNSINNLFHLILQKVTCGSLVANRLYKKM